MWRTTLRTVRFRALDTGMITGVAFPTQFLVFNDVSFRGDIGDRSASAGIMIGCSTEHGDFETAALLLVLCVF